eukprot:PhM_4_TR1148/c0_g1_i1/m.61790
MATAIPPPSSSSSSSLYLQALSRHYTVGTPKIVGSTARSRTMTTTAPTPTTSHNNNTARNDINFNYPFYNNNNRAFPSNDDSNSNNNNNGGVHSPPFASTKLNNSGVPTGFYGDDGDPWRHQAAQSHSNSARNNRGRRGVDGANEKQQDPQLQDVCALARANSPVGAGSHYKSGAAPRTLYSTPSTTTLHGNSKAFWAGVARNTAIRDGMEQERGHRRESAQKDPPRRAGCVATALEYSVAPDEEDDHVAANVAALGRDVCVVSATSSVDDDARAFAVLLKKYPMPSSTYSTVIEALRLGSVSPQDQDQEEQQRPAPPQAATATVTCRHCGSRGQSGSECTECGCCLPDAVACWNCAWVSRGYFCIQCGCEINNATRVDETKAQSVEAPHHEAATSRVHDEAVHRTELRKQTAATARRFDGEPYHHHHHGDGVAAADLRTSSLSPPVSEIIRRAKSASKSLSPPRPSHIGELTYTQHAAKYHDAWRMRAQNTQQQMQPHKGLSLVSGPPTSSLMSSRNASEEATDECESHQEKSTATTKPHQILRPPPHNNSNPNHGNHLHVALPPHSFSSGDAAAPPQPKPFWMAAAGENSQAPPFELNDI